MMNCKDCQTKLDRYVDRELSATEAVEVQLHLEGCPGCQDHYTFEANLKRLVKDSCGCETPPAFRDKLRQLLT
jgi:mycothiol system anti-sigma-R factor